MKLYYSRGACSLAARIIINEVGLPCEFEAVDLKTKTTASGADYKHINLKGAVPALQLDNGEILTENAIIQQYVVEKSNATHLLPPHGDMKRFHTLEWLNFVASDLHKGIGILFNGELSQESKEKVVIPNAIKKLTFVEKRLSDDRKFLMGDEFTLPDGYLFVMLLWTHKLKLPMTDLAHLQRYFKEVGLRKSVQQSLQEEGLDQ